MTSGRKSTLASRAFLSKSFRVLEHTGTLTVFIILRPRLERIGGRVFSRQWLQRQQYVPPHLQGKGLGICRFSTPIRRFHLGEAFYGCEFLRLARVRGFRKFHPEFRFALNQAKSSSALSVESPDLDRILFAAQCHHRVDLCGAARGNQSCRKRRKHQQERDRGKSGG